LESIVAISQASPSAPQWTAVEWAALLAGGGEPAPLLRRVLVAESGDGSVAGVAVFTLLLAVFPPDAELESLAVDPRQRRRGFGAALLQEVAAESVAAGAEVLSLEVRGGNGGAIALYRRLGFKPVGIRKGYYASPTEDAVLMQLPLPKPSTQKSNDLMA
jgi:ribosomal-protein-alanine N-acetyltransferase